MNVGGNMVYTCKYKSLIGDILLAADEIGLTGLWFEGQKYFANTLPKDHIQQETEILTHGAEGVGVWMYISSVKNRTLLHYFIRTVQHSERQCGRFYWRFPMDRRLHMEKLRAELQ